MRLELKKEYHESDGKSWYVLYAEKSDGEFRKEYFTDNDLGLGMAKARFEELKGMTAIPEPEVILSYNSKSENHGKGNDN